MIISYLLSPILAGPNLEFTIDSKLAFEVPLQNVSKCIAAKNEATLEFQENDDAPVALTEMRLVLGRGTRDKKVILTCQNIDSTGVEMMAKFEVKLPGSSLIHRNSEI